MIRRPLNGLDARTAQETRLDPFDWADADVRSAILGGSFPGTRRRKPRRRVTIQTDRSLKARIARTARALWRWLCSASPWSGAR